MELEKKVMLVVDDIEMNRAILREYFQGEYEILEASDGGEAYRILEEAFVDILVTDLNMPGLDGFGLIEKVRGDSRFDLLKIIAITEALELEETDRERLKDLGADDVIEKPFSTELLCHRVRGVMSGVKLLARAEQFRFCMEFSPIPFGVVRLLRGAEDEPKDMEYCYVNHAYGNVLNIPAVNIIGRTHFSLTTEHGATWLLLLENVEKTGEADSATIFYDGLQKYYSLNLYQDVDDYFIFSMGDVTEQKMTELSLRESEQKYKLALEGADVFTWEYDIGNKRIIQSQGYQRTNSYPAVIENVPEVFFQTGYVKDESREAFRELYRQVQEGVPQVHGEFWVRDLKGESWYKKRTTYYVTKDEDGRPYKAYGAGMDITRSALGELRYSEEEEYRRQVQPGMLAVSCINLTAEKVEDVYYRDTKQKYEKNSFSTDYREWIEVWLQEVHLSGQDADELGIEALLDAYRRGKEVVKKEFWAVWRSTRDVVWIQVEVRMFGRPETGEIIAYFYNRDITVERMQNSLIKSAIELDYDCVSYINIRNKHYKMYFGEGSEEDEGSDYDAIVRAHVGRVVVTDDAEAVVEAMSLRTVLLTLEKQPVYTYEYDMQEKDGSIHRKMLRFFYADREMGLIVITRSDIQQLISLEREKQDRLEQALETARQASLAKSEFLSRMSHDIRTPMNAILGMTSIAKGECRDERILDCLDQIEGAGKFLLRLINDILDISKIESGKLVLKEEVSAVESLIGSIEATVIPLMEEKNITFHLHQSLDYDHILIDEVRFKQIFFNLLSNAAKYTQEGGNVTFSVEETGRSDRISRVRFQVQDDGIGMSPEFLEHAFEPFMQEANDNQTQNQGTGLGLAIVKNLVELMNGKIAVESERGKGTTFVVDMPLTLASGSGLKEEEHPSEEVSRLRGKRILLVEDNHINTIVARQLLESKGVAVEHASNGKDAVDLYQLSERGRYDLILMDIRMPVMNGLEAAETIRGFEREDAKTIPIIAMTANAYEEDIQKSISAGMNGHLAKPIEPKLFYQELLKWIK